jgi:hypothetical protein
MWIENGLGRQESLGYPKVDTKVSTYGIQNSKLLLSSGYKDTANLERCLKRSVNTLNVV